MHQSEYLFDVLIFLTAMIVIVPVFQRFKLSPILGYLAAGMIIGPYGLKLIGDTSAAQTLASFGVVFLLFMIGLELSFRRLRALGGKVFGLGSAQVIISGIMIAATAAFFGQGITSALIIGGGLALSSTAFVLQLLDERGERASRFGLTTFSILLLQDLAVVPILIFVTLAGAPDTSLVETFTMAALKGGVAFLVVIAFGRFLLRPLYHMIARTRSVELFVSATLLTVLGMAWVMSLAGLSMELGALLAGLLLGETEYRHQIKADIKPFRGILLGLFFITIGMAIDIGFIAGNLIIIMSIVAALIIGKAVVITLLCRITGTPFAVALRSGLALAQGGEFGFVIFGAAFGAGLFLQNTVQILMAVIAISMIATPGLFYLGKFLSTAISKRFSDGASSSQIDIQPGKDHVLIAGFGRVGQTIANVLSQAGISYVALDLDQKRVRKCRDRGLPVYYGDAAGIHVMEAAGVARAKMVIITIDDTVSARHAVKSLRGQYADLPIFVRARDRKQLHLLEEAGANAAVYEAAESSLQLGGIALQAMDLCPDEITSLIDEYRQDEYAKLDEIIGGK